MRFKSNKKSGIIITKKWFAFLPVYINGETRWLEFVKVRGYYLHNELTNNWYWKNIEFLNK